MILRPILSRAAVWLPRQNTAAAMSCTTAEPTRPIDNMGYHRDRIRRDEAGVPGLRPLDLRRSHASHVVMNGVPVPVVSQLLGHANASMTLSYALVAEQAIKDAAERAGNSRKS